MIPGWRIAPMGEVMAEFYDGPHATPPPADKGPVYLGIKNMTEDGHLDLSDIRHISEDDYANWTRRVEPRPGDVVFTYEASLHRYAIIPEGFRGALGRRVALLRPDSRLVDTQFLLYAFIGSEWRRTVEARLNIGSTVDRVPLVDFPNYPITLPPLSTQRKIAAILSAYDDLIENNNRRIKLLEEMTQRIYREWFIDFRYPGHEHAALVESQNGQLPREWRQARLGDVVQEIRRGCDPRSVDPDTPYIGLEHMPRRSIALAEWGRAGDVQSTKLSFREGEILFGKIRPYFHKVGVAPINGVCSTDIIVLSPRSAELFPIVLACVSSAEFVSHASQTSQGTKMPRANWDVLKKHPIVLPPEPLHSTFGALTQDIVQSIRNFLFRNRNLRATRDLLLPRLISGEIDVGDLHIASPEAA